MEAFKESTPTIVRDLGGMPELVRESGGGFIYKTDDELVQAMDLLMNDPGYRHLLGRKAYASYLEKWSADRHINDYLALIEEISAQRKADTSLNVQRPGPGYGRMKRI
jgi:glycosyltransferase involved in cell wall biosynthesis